MLRLPRRSRRAARCQILHSRYLYIVDVVTVPKRLENTVGEAERQNVLRGFLAQKVVDTVNLVLLEHRGIDTVQLARRVQIIAERLSTMMRV